MNVVTLDKNEKSTTIGGNSSATSDHMLNNKERE